MNKGIQHRPPSSATRARKALLQDLIKGISSPGCNCDGENFTYAMPPLNYDRNSESGGGILYHDTITTIGLARTGWLGYLLSLWARGSLFVAA